MTRHVLVYADSTVELKGTDWPVQATFKMSWAPAMVKHVGKASQPDEVLAHRQMASQPVEVLVQEQKASQARCLCR